MTTTSGPLKYDLETLYGFLKKQTDAALTESIQNDLQQDEELMAVVQELDLAIDNGLSLDDIRQRKKWLRSSVGQLSQNENLNARVTRIRRISTMRYLSVAAGFLLLAVVSFLLLRPQTPQSWQAYAEPFPNVITTRSDVNNDLLTAMELYDSENYKESAKLLSDFVKTNPDQIEAKFYAGVSAFLANDYETAERFFGSFNQDEGIFKKEIKWFYALTLLAQNKGEEAIPMLKELADGSGPLSRKSNEILNSLK